MWKRDEAVRPSDPGAVPSREASAAATPAPTRRPSADAGRAMERDVVNIGKSIVIKGELNGSEDLTIEGQVDGKIELRQHVLTVGPNGKIKAQVFAKSVVVLGEVTGNIVASDKVNIRENGAVDGDIKAPRVAIAEGAHFRGSIDMQREGAQAGADGKSAGEGKAGVKSAQAPPRAQAAQVVQR